MVYLERDVSKDEGGMGTIREYFPYIHKKCGGVAFYSYHKFEPGEPLRVNFVLLINGENPKPGDPIDCGNCGERLSELTDEALEYFNKTSVVTYKPGVESDPSI